MIVIDELSPPASWPLAVVSQMHPGKDDLVQVVTLRTTRSTFLRPVVKLIKLPPDEETGTFLFFCKRSSDQDSRMKIFSFQYSFKNFQCNCVHFFFVLIVSDVCMSASMLL